MSTSVSSTEGIEEVVGFGGGTTEVDAIPVTSVTEGKLESKLDKVIEICIACQDEGVALVEGASVVAVGSDTIAKEVAGISSEAGIGDDNSTSK